MTKPLSQAADEAEIVEISFEQGIPVAVNGEQLSPAALMRKLSPGQILEIHATDASLAVDLAAWCRLTGNTLLEQRGARYLVRRS